MARFSGMAWLFVWTAIGLMIWGAASWSYVLWWPHPLGIAGTLFRTQDLPALALAIVGLLACAPFAGRGTDVAPARLSARRAVLAILLFALAAWAIWHLWLDGYALSRDEEVAQFGAAYMAQGHLALPIPAEWMPYRRAVMPEFFLPFGADHYWASAYLPVNSAFRALWVRLGDGALAGPVLVAVGLAALWRVSRYLFADRADAQIVALVMAMSSLALLLTAATPYAMTAHFALNMLWLALVLRDSRVSHAGAALVAVLIAGVHQWHFPLIFLAPFLLWFALQRRWGLVLLHGVAMTLAVVVWAKLWPALLQAQLGPPADIMPAGGVGDKVGSLFARLEKWRPLPHLARFVVWNNLLLVPLAAIGLVRQDWRAALRGNSPVLPLGLGCLGAAALTIDQGYGWGYRYLHGYIGCFALLAGYGWIALGSRSLRPVWLSALLALLVGGFLFARARHDQHPYALADRLIHQADVDVVLVDPSRGRYVTDLVRGRDGNPLGRPVVLSLAMLTPARLDTLCARKSVGIFDDSTFRPLGVATTSWSDRRIAGLRLHLADRRCGVPLRAPPR